MGKRTRPVWPLVLDSALDAVVLSFAVWTLFYQIALVGQFSMLPAAWPWIVLTGCLMLAAAVRAARRTDHGAAADGEQSPRRAALPPWGGAKTLAVGLAVLALTIALRGSIGVVPVAVTVIVILVLQLAPWWTRRHPTVPVALPATEPAAEPTAAAHLFALAVSLGFGALGLFLVRPDADDAFYVNRATWVAQHGTAATNDTMFSPNTLAPANAGGLLTPSIESLQGVVAHALGIQAPTVCYVLAVPVLGAMTVWTTWRLLRAVAPRRAWLALAVAVVFILASGDSVVGGYSLGRIWQGKATAYAILIPLVWVLLIRTAGRARRADLVMLVAAGVAFVGLTTTSALLAPVIAGAALVAAGLLRSRSLAWGAAAFLVAPLVNGLAQAFGPATVGEGVTDVISTQSAFNLVVGISAAMVLLTLACVALIPWLAPGASGVILGCGGLATMVALLPGVFDVVHIATGAGPVAWRLLIVVPVWAVVGLAATVPMSWSTGSPAARRRGRTSQRAAAGLMAAVLVAVPVVFGTWLWAAPGAYVSSRPTWKVDQADLADLRSAQSVTGVPANGSWLLPPGSMLVMAVADTGPFPVVSRPFYLPGLRTSRQDRADRQTLLELAAGLPTKAGNVRAALERLDVPLACVDRYDDRAKRTLRDATGDSLERAGNLRCHVDRDDD